MQKSRAFTPYEVIKFTSAFGVSLRLVVPALNVYATIENMPTQDEIWDAVQAAWQDLYKGEKGEFNRGRNKTGAAKDFKRIVHHVLMYEIGLPSILVTAAMGGKSHNGAYISAQRHIDIAAVSHEEKYRETHRAVADFMMKQFFGI